jgi:hypothetical protein
MCIALAGLESNGIQGKDVMGKEDGMLMIFKDLAGAGDRDRTGDVQLGKLAFYR